MVASEFDRVRIFPFVFLIALFGLGVGVLISVLLNDWDHGGFIGGSMFALVAVLQGAVVSLCTFSGDKWTQTSLDDAVGTLFQLICPTRDAKSPG